MGSVDLELLHTPEIDVFHAKRRHLGFHLPLNC